MQTHLGIALSAAVPLCIQEIDAKGGPSVDDFSEASQFSQVLGEKGDVLLFGSKKKGEAADLFNRTAKAIAVLSFVPGGVTLFGCHYESKMGAE